MPKEFIKIGEAELEIMKVLWKAGDPLGSGDIGKAVEDKGWKRTTIATFLARLVEKGAISTQKRGNVFYYSPLITDKEYKRLQIKNLIKNLFNGSARDMAVSLFEEESFSEEEIKELREVFKEKED